VKTMTIQSEITREGTLKIEVPCDLPPGPVEVELTVRCPNGLPEQPMQDWDQLYGLGREVWAGVDARQYVQDLRQD